MVSARAGRGWRYRANVAARTAAATLGGYGVAALSAGAGARLLPLPRIDATLIATMLAFAVMPGVAIWAFLARSAARAWAAIAFAAAVLAALPWLAAR